jgi:hypothetical protein
MTALSEEAIEKLRQEAKNRPRDSHGRFIKVSEVLNPPTVSNWPKIISTSEPYVKTDKSIPPLLSFSVTNPVKYLKIWWKRIMSREGVDLRLHIRPVTAVAIVLIITGFGFGVGRLVPSSTMVKYIPLLAPTPSPNPWRDTAYIGTLKKSTNGKFYLFTSASESITLELPVNIDLTKYIGKRIFAAGEYNKDTGVLKISSALDLELLPLKPSPIPTTIPSPTPTFIPTVSPSS